MKTKTKEMRAAFPHARTERMIVRQLDDETLIYDTARHKALCLNKTAAFIWHHCDGKTPASTLARELGTHFNTVAPEEVVHLGLARLSKQGLLREQLHTPRAVTAAAMTTTMPRRAMLHRAGVAAAISLPLVTAIIAPTAAQAATLGGSTAPCNSGSDCASGVCNGAAGCQ
ncbi:MAG: PqqD family protein [Pyrinomonadaceae bacterium MAG19_C2-C3]|nr:PqqD family protein [Pyrinomonadaceae bacterium MAG19_C2-C3]